MIILIITLAITLSAITYFGVWHGKKFKSCKYDTAVFFSSTGLGQLALFTIIWLCGPHDMPDHHLPVVVDYAICFSLFYFFSFIPGAMIAATVASILEGDF